jgi:ElaB/YqjD/DUF883 family membrane-anchored ribosome-binding protein
MGKDPDEVQRQIVKKRREIEARVQGVRHRVREDVQGLRGAAGEQANDVVGQAKSFVDVQHHPYSVLVGALSLGVVLGMASEGFGNGSSPENARASSTARRDTSDAVGGAFASVLSAAGDTLRDEVSQLIREGMSGLRAAARGEESRRAA